MESKKEYISTSQNINDNQQCQNDNGIQLFNANSQYPGPENKQYIKKKDNTLQNNHLSETANIKDYRQNHRVEKSDQDIHVDQSTKDFKFDPDEDIDSKEYQIFTKNNNNQNQENFQGQNEQNNNNLQNKQSDFEEDFNKFLDYDSVDHSYVSGKKNSKTNQKRKEIEIEFNLKKSKKQEKLQLYQQLQEQQQLEQQNYCQIQKNPSLIDASLIEQYRELQDSEIQQQQTNQKRKLNKKKKHLDYMLYISRLYSRLKGNQNIIFNYNSQKIKEILEYKNTMKITKIDIHLANLGTIEDFIPLYELHLQQLFHQIYFTKKQQDLKKKQMLDRFLQCSSSTASDYITMIKKAYVKGFFKQEEFQGQAGIEKLKKVEYMDIKKYNIVMWKEGKCQSKDIDECKVFNEINKSKNI